MLKVLVKYRPSSGCKICFQGNFHSFLFCISSSGLNPYSQAFSGLFISFGEKCDKREEEIGDLIYKGPSTAGVYVGLLMTVDPGISESTLAEGAGM